MNKGFVRFVPTAAIAVAALCLALVAASGPGYRLGILDLRTAINFVKWSGELSLAGALLSLIGAAVVVSRRLPRARLIPCVVALVVSLALLTNGLRMKHKAESLPPIHDVTTNPQDIPVYHAIAPLRADAPNALEYDGEIEALQTHFYPDLKPLDLATAPPETFEKALGVVKSFGWEIVAADPSLREIEAIDTTTWFGFKDDVIVRIRPFESGSRLDMRSTSRVGVSDLGVNAQRIREFIKRFKAL